MIFLGFFKHKKIDPDSGKITPKLLDWPEHVITLDKKNFEKFIQKYPLSIIDFWAPWCAPCKAMAPRVRRLSIIYKGKVAFGKLDTQENKDIAKKYRIMGIPHLVFFRYGKKVTSTTGVKSVNDIKELIEDVLKKKDR